MRNSVKWFRDKISDMDKFEKIITIIIVISFFLMMLPLFTKPYPNYIFNGDVALHYKLTSFILNDPSNIAYEIYPKGFHVLNAFVALSGIGIGSAMYFVTFIFAVLFPFLMYKLSNLISQDRRIAILSAFFSLSIIVYTGGLSSLSTPAPQTLAFSFMVLSLYFFLSGKYLFSGITIGIQGLIHGSWPLSILFILLYTLMRILKERNLSYFKGFVTSLLISFVFIIPWKLYILNNVIHDTIIKTVIDTNLYFGSMISVFYLPLILTPFFTIVFVLYGMYRIRKNKNKLTNYFNYKFLIYVFILIVLMSQAFFFFSDGQILGITFIPSRVLVFLVIPASILTSYILIDKFGNKKNVIILICLVFLVVSFFQNNTWYENKPHLDKNDLEAIGFFQKEPVGSLVLYNPIKYNQEDHFIIFSGKKERVESDAGFIMLMKADLDHSIDYILENKEDDFIKPIINKNTDLVKRIYSNNKYNIYKVTSSKHLDKFNLEDYVLSFSGFFNQNSKLHNIFVYNVSVLVESGNESVCFSIKNRLEINCGGEIDLKISGDKKYLKELFTTYSTSEFIFRFLQFFDRGWIDLKSTNYTKILIYSGNPIKFGLGKKYIYLKDVDLYLKADISKSKINITLDKIPIESETMSLRFFSRASKWTLLNSIHTFPNLLISIPYAYISELIL